jgi:BolA protein
MSMQQRIRQALEALQADFLQVEDESHLHSRGLESHF